jgi:hypothetical protein
MPETLKPRPPAPLRYTGIAKIDAALTDAWRRGLRIEIKASQVEPLFEEDPPWTSWSVMLRRPDRAPGTALSLYDSACYAHLFWHSRRGRTRFSGGWSYSWGGSRRVRTGKDLARAIFHVSI